MNGEFRISGNLAILHAPLADAARAQLRAQRPAALELVGDWRDLAVLSEVADAVERITVSGDLERGKIVAVDGLRHFSRLKKLHLASVVKQGYDLGVLPVLEAFEGPWQADAKSAFDHPSLRSIALRAFPQADLTALCTKGSSGLTTLWLSNSKLENLHGIQCLKALTQLRITDAPKLVSLDGLDSPCLEVLDVENASKLSDVAALAAVPRLKKLRLLSTAPQVDLHPLEALEHLEGLQVGGRVLADIPWEQLAARRSLKRIFAWWDPVTVTEERIRAASERSGKSIVKFEPVDGKGRRPLLVEWD